MSVNKIVSASGSNDLRSISRVGGGLDFNKREFKTDLNTNLVTEEESRLNPSYANYVWSSGTNIDTNGQIVFTSASGYGSLSEALIINRGSNTAYIGINSETISVSGGTSLITNESIQFDETISTIWAISASGNINIEVNGISSRNRNTI